MSNAALRAGEDASARVRKERVQTTMLIELLALLVFMSMVFAFVLRDEDARTNPWKEKYYRLEISYRQLQHENRDLRIRLRADDLKLRTMEETIRRLVAAHDGPLAANDKLAPMTKAQADQIVAQLANAEAMVAERQNENATLRRELAASKGGGTNLPICTVTAGHLIDVELLGDGRYRVRPLWTAGAASAVAKVDGALALAHGGPFSSSEFLNRASQVDKWGRNQPTPCVFRVQVHEAHGNLSLYKQQLRIVEQHFYASRR